MALRLPICAWKPILIGGTVRFDAHDWHSMKYRRVDWSRVKIVSAEPIRIKRRTRGKPWPPERNKAERFTKGRGRDCGPRGVGSG
jgi:hypothetical protein